VGLAAHHEADRVIPETEDQRRLDPDPLPRPAEVEMAPEEELGQVVVEGDPRPDPVPAQPDGVLGRQGGGEEESEGGGT
jgi:hypothetical protein